MSKHELPPIQAWFVNRQVPFGDAPRRIKEQWVDVPLPLRQMSPSEAPEVHIGHGLKGLLDVHVIDDGMAVYGSDAVKALVIFGREEAANFWEEVIYSDQTLIFTGKEGQVYPPSVIQRILPGIEFFDEMEV